MKSNVSDYLELALRIYADACAKCSAGFSDLRDVRTITSRVEREGLSFLTITLPTFARDLDRALARGFIETTDFRSFKKSGAIPAFLQGMLSLVFDRETGRLYERTSANSCDRSAAIDGVRQVSLAFKKLELECDPKRVARSLAGFIQIERDFSSFTPPEVHREEFSGVSSVLWDHLLADLRLDLLVPRHGPGATAERIRGNSKYAWRRWHERLEVFFPLLGSAYSISAADAEEFELVTFVCEEQEQPVRVITVPKTLKGPRIIAIEPVCMQFVQQAIRAELYNRLESYPLTAGHVNFTDQSVNQRLALRASVDGRLATIDLSEASDRVPRDLALSMFDGNPDLRDAIDSCRSTSAQMPDGEVISPLRKFASMGSALCFPVEAMYFYTVCVAALLRRYNLPVSYKTVMHVSRNIYVYGDDILVPVDAVDVVLDYLQKYNCKVNADKSFWTGKFRESCGVDAFEGEMVTPTYVRKLIPENKQQAQELISWTELANALYLKGYWRSAQWCYDIVEKHIGPLPYVERESPALGRVSYLGYKTVHRWSQKLHRWEVRAQVMSPVYEEDTLEGYAALWKSLSKLEALPDLYATRDKHHLQRSARYGTVTLKSRWVPV